jgi:prepilin-type N-terminal cleavage/methylation domain-containing protein
MMKSIYLQQKPPALNNKNKAFTLVELAIVIVIIGLLVGGVLAGQELIRQAKMRTMMKAVEDYKTAIVGFKAKYNCNPGDCPNAHRFFDDKGCGTNNVVSSTTTTGCNGDGNNIISVAEGMNVWAHLSYANLIKGSFTPGYKSSITAGVDVPPVPVDDSVGISIVYSQGGVSSANSCGYWACPEDANRVNIMGYMPGKNIFAVGNVRQGWLAGSASGAFFTPLEALEFDVKFDDGLAYRGMVTGFKGRLPNGDPGTCADTSLYPVGDYKTTGTQKDLDVCMMVFDSGLN